MNHHLLPLDALSVVVVNVSAIGCVGRIILFSVCLLTAVVPTVADVVVDNVVSCSNKDSSPELVSLLLH